ncbi:MAG: nucleotidyl transferase AbiEii/AbiGii toxin family protein [Candidatus Peribacteria bacterium]|nr:nucleotidyl transferase AbiEii/AbiGii toxin family protein [Candidatus Peribacteria bacterium]
MDKPRIELLPYLKPFQEMGFYLAGGTALALYFGHRESVDFDFFTATPLVPEVLFEQCVNIFSPLPVQKTLTSENTLYILVNEIKISFMTYDYPLV